MTRFLIMTGPYPGHFAPSMPIVRRLVECGHEVVWITGRQFKGKVETAGARFHPLPKESDPNEMETYDFYPELKKLKGLAQIKYWIKHIMLDACSRDIKAIDTVLTDYPADVLIGDTVMFAPYFISEMGGPSSAQISLLPLSLASRDTAPFGLGLLPGNNLITKSRNRLLNFLFYHVLLRDVTLYANYIRRELRLNPLNGPFFSAMFKIPSLIMQISTPVLEYPRSDLPENIRFIGPILPKPDPAFRTPHWWSDLNCSKPVILVNQGTLAKNLYDLIVPTIEGLQDEQMLVVAIPVEKGHLGELPVNVRAESFIPFNHLLPYVNVMVTNGGYGGTQFALAHGIPLVIWLAKPRIK